MVTTIKIIFAVFTCIIILVILVIQIGNWVLRLPKLDVDRSDPTASEKLEIWFSDLSKRKVIPFNGAVLVRRGDDVLLRKTYGVDSQGRDLTFDSPLRLGSISKQFTAVGILTLVETNKIDLDAPISTYLQGCDFTAPVRTLLNHTSGIPDRIYRVADGSSLLTLEKVEELICDGSVVQKSQKYKYSNTGYLLAARIIERVTGKSFEDYMQSAVFDPLEMNQSRVWNLVSNQPFPERAGGFSIGKKGKTILEPSNLDGVAGDGGVFSTLQDLENWDRFWRDDRLISQRLKHEALTPNSGDYGFGWIRDGESVWHNGSWLGARTYMRRDLKTGDLIILLDNSSNVQVDSIGVKLSQFLAE